MNTYLKFDCGARLPGAGGPEKPFFESARDLGLKPRKDGRYPLIVAGSLIGSGARPMMGNGLSAPCMNGCPCKGSSGRRETRLFLTGIIVTCYPQEVEI